MKKVLLLAALKIESLGVIKKLRLRRIQSVSGIKIWQSGSGGDDIILGRTGAGLSNSRHTTEKLLDHYRPAMVINLGTAGALIDNLETGSLIIPPKIINEKEEIIEIDSHLLKRLTDKLNISRCDFHQGTLLTCRKAVNKVKVRRQLQQKYSALAVDMEAFEIACIAAEKSIPFFCVKVISDAAGRFALGSFFLHLTRINKTLAEIIYNVITNFESNDKNSIPD